VVEFADDVPTVASVPWTWEKKPVGTLPVMSLDGVGSRFHDGTPVEPVADS